MTDHFNSKKRFTTRELRILLDTDTTDKKFDVICSITDLKGTILYANRMFCEISKYTHDELVGQNHRLLNSGHHPKEFFIEMWQTISKGSVWHNEIRNKAKDGTFYWVDTIILPVFNSSGKCIQYFSLRTPIDEKKNAAIESEERIKELEKLLFKISHEVRHPVTQILGISSILEQSNVSGKDLKTIAHAMSKSAKLLDKYTHELNDLVHQMRLNERI